MYESLHFSILSHLEEITECIVIMSNLKKKKARHVNMNINSEFVFWSLDLKVNCYLTILNSVCILFQSTFSCIVCL